MIKRLRIKFVCINMVIFSAMLCVIFSLVLFFMGLGMELRSQNLMENIADNALGPVRRAAPQEGRRPYFVVQVRGPEELLVLDRGYFGEINPDTLQAVTQEAMDQKEVVGKLEAHKLRFQKSPAQGGQLIVFMDTSSEINTLKNLAAVCTLIGGLSFGVFFLISCWLAKWAVRPVEEAWNQQQQFVADASHELKTPLTVILTNAELLQSGGYGEGEQRKFIGSILTMSHQMRGLVEGLLDLARVDNGMAKMAFDRVDLSGLVQEELLPFEPVCFEKELLLESFLEENLRVRGSAGHLRQVLDILLDNASKYSAAGGTVLVTLKRQGNHCLLAVSNPGDAISREDLKNIFKRFYRIDKARSMNRSYGLGLSIAESIVAEHGGKIWAESGEGINSFFVQLPLL